MKVVKEVCPHCKKAIEFTTKQKIMRVLGAVFGNFFVVMGIVFLIFLLVVGWEEPINTFMNRDFARYNDNIDLELRTITINATEGCEADSFCYAEKLFNHVSHVRYVPSSLKSFDEGGMYDPLYVYNHGGDCKNTAFMYVSMLKSVGIYAYVDCSIGDKHCVSVVPHVRVGEDFGEKMVVDLTIPLYVEMGSHETTWDYLDIYLSR